MLKVRQHPGKENSMCKDIPPQVYAGTQYTALTMAKGGTMPQKTGTFSIPSICLSITFDILYYKRKRKFLHFPNLIL